MGAELGAGQGLSPGTASRQASLVRVFSASRSKNFSQKGRSSKRCRAAGSPMVGPVPLVSGLTEDLGPFPQEVEAGAVLMDDVGVPTSSPTASMPS